METIDTEGDVILVVGPTKVKLKVSSRYLRFEPKLLAAMFGPDWKEGQQVSETNPPEVALEDDDAESTRMILYVLHFRVDLKPDRLSAKLLAQVAIAADKYGTLLRLRSTSSRWLQIHPSRIVRTR